MCDDGGGDEDDAGDGDVGLNDDGGRPSIVAGVDAAVVAAAGTDAMPLWKLSDDALE